jgi:hypothetical protein
MCQLQSSSPFFQPGPPALPGQQDAGIMGFLKPRVRGRILDMGGGRGAYAHALAQSGHSVTLAELDPASLEVAASLGLDVLDMNQVSWESLENRFDTVMLIEMLEHVEDPLDFLRRVSRCAKKILLTVPCNDDFPALFRWGLTYNHVAVSDHLHQFTRADIVSLLRQAGYRAEVHTGAYLFPVNFISLLYHSMGRSVLGRLFVVPLWALNKLGWLPRRFPSRIFAEAYVE